MWGDLQMSEETLTEKQDSIKVSKGMNGKYSFEIKRYYDFEKTKPKDVIQQLQKIDAELKTTFGGGSDVEHSN